MYDNSRLPYRLIYPPTMHCQWSHTHYGSGFTEFLKWSHVVLLNYVKLHSTAVGANFGKVPCSESSVWPNRLTVNSCVTECHVFCQFCSIILVWSLQIKKGNLAHVDNTLTCICFGREVYTHLCIMGRGGVAVCSVPCNRRVAGSNLHVPQATE